MEGCLDFDTIDGDNYTHYMTGSNQAEIRLNLEEALENILEEGGIDFEYVETVRLNETMFMVMGYDSDGEAIGNGFIEFDEL